MNTPLWLAVQEYCDENRARFHMPGHKGAPLAPFGELLRYDITEVLGCDSLFDATGAIAETEARYANLYGARASLLSAGGSTLCIQTMLALVAKPGGKLIICRGCHVAACNALALLDLMPVWAYPQTDMATGLANAVTAEEIEALLAKDPDACAVYVTSPDYYGVLCDIAAISVVCRAHKVPLLVDNAHGAHLKFLPKSLHPMDLGADMCCDSLHKQLPVLTGGAVLHIQNADFIPQAKRFMSIFGSTSPSYLILLSIDTALAELSGFADKLARTIAVVRDICVLAAEAGFALPAGALDPLRITLGFAQAGYTSAEFAVSLRAAGIEPEYIGERFCVLMASPYNTIADFAKLRAFLTGFKALPPLPNVNHPPLRPLQRLRPAETLFAKTRPVAVEDAVGKVAGNIVCPCPPGIPLVTPGELVDKNLAQALKNYGISRIYVLE